MKVVVFAAVLLVGFSQATFADSLMCSNSNASVQLKVGNYEGGAIPKPGQRLTWSDLRSGRVWHLDVAYSLGQRKDLSSKKDTSYLRETFVANLRAKTPNGVVEAFVLCDSKKYIGLPRP